MDRLSDYFASPLYLMIFEQDLPYMSQEAMEALLNIGDWYASPDDTFIKMYNTKKASHLLPNLSTNKMVM